MCLARRAESSCGGIWLPKGFSYLSGVPTPKRKRRILVPLQAWIDDSGVKGQGAWMALAGLIGSAEEWEEFTDLWDAELHREPPIDYLSTSDAATRTGQFSRWPVSKRDAKVRRLARIANRFPFTIVSISVDLAAYADFFAGTQIPRKGKAVRLMRMLTQQPYLFCFQNVCSAVCIELRKRGVTEQIDLLFDDQFIMEPRIEEWYPLYLTGLEPEQRVIMPPRPIFRDDKEFKPLQAADLVAWIDRAEAEGGYHPFGRLRRDTKNLTRSRYCARWHRERFSRLKVYANSSESRSAGAAAYEEALWDAMGKPGEWRA